MESTRNDSKPEIKKEVVQAESKETNQEHKDGKTEKHESIFAKTKIKKSPEKGIFCNEFSMQMCYHIHCKCTVTRV